MQQQKSRIQELYHHAIEALNRGDWRMSADIAGQLLPVAHEHAGVQFIAGVAALGLRSLPTAVAHLSKAVRLNPARADYHAQLARAWAIAGNMRAAHESAIDGLRLDTADAVTCNTLGVVLTQANDHLRARAAFEAAVAHDADNPDYRFNLGNALTFNGDVKRAEEEYEACILRAPRYWKAHLALAQLKTQSPASNHIQRLQALLVAHSHEDEARMFLHLAISRELEDLERHPEALHHLIEGKSVVARKRPYEWTRDQKLFETLLQTFRELPQDAPGYDSNEPIFVVGMPRSGTTLVERILSNHPHVHSAGELNNFPLAVKRSSGSQSTNLLDLDVLECSARIEWGKLGKMYVESTRPSTGHTPRFIDKLPHNFMYVGHILRALPNARIVCLRRDAMDTCLGNFRQLFALDSPHYDYSFDLLDTGRYQLLFEKLMRGWNDIHPGRIHEVQYEELVSDQEMTTRALLAFCGLPWDEQSLAFHENAAPTATASTIQVREPLHGRFQGRWKRYGAGLDPLRDLLEQARSRGI